jgi:thiol-disulfide isomerase/thioredoxin
MNNANGKKDQNKKKNIKVIGIIIAMIGIAIILYLLFIGYGSNTRSDNVTINKIEQVSQENPVVLYFWSDGCYYCNEEKPIIEDLEKEYDTSNVTFYWIDSSKNRDLTSHYDVMGYPTTIVLDQNGIVKKYIGYYNYTDIATGIDDAIATYI